MSLDDRDWYRDAIKRQDDKQIRTSTAGMDKTLLFTDYSVGNVKAVGIMALFFIFFTAITYVAEHYVYYPATIGLISVNIMIFALVNIHKMSVKQLGVSCALVKKYKQYYRIISSEFTHENAMHIVCNMYSLYNIGSVLERILGTELYTAAYFFIAIAGGILSFIIHRKYQPYVISIGASGIICGLLGVYIAIAFHFTGFRALLSVAQSIVLLILMVFSRHIDSIGHFSGLATGIITGVAVVSLFY